MVASCILGSTQALVVVVLDMRAERGNIARLLPESVPRQGLGKSVEEVNNRMKNMAQSHAIAIFHGCHRAILTVGCAAHKCLSVGICVILIGWHTIAPAGSERQSSTPKKAGAKLSNEHTPRPRGRPPEKRTTRGKDALARERMLPMESNVGNLSSASFWAADLHRRTCEWEFLWT
jgi:hypothetical protein